MYFAVKNAMKKKKNYRKSMRVFPSVKTADVILKKPLSPVRLPLRVKAGRKTATKREEDKCRCMIITAPIALILLKNCSRLVTMSHKIYNAKYVAQSHIKYFLL